MLQNFYENVTQAIRQVDVNHIILLEGDFFAMDFSAIQELKDEQTAITFHFYPTVWEADLCDIDYPRQRRREILKTDFIKCFQTCRNSEDLFCAEKQDMILQDTSSGMLWKW